MPGEVKELSVVVAQKCFAPSFACAVITSLTNDVLRDDMAAWPI